MFTRRDVKQGDAMAVIPVELGYTVKSGSQKLVSTCYQGTATEIMLGREGNR